VDITHLHRSGATSTRPVSLSSIVILHVVENEKQQPVRYVPVSDGNER
jgi:hypothetical protein